ncbi:MULTISPECIES: hypothetical protein [Parafrankia]|nr:MULTISPECIES: hypothetical protein [Parafrankia]MBE3201692.1 hypothetical protein [Parafrankia sp. CH37]
MPLPRPDRRAGGGALALLLAAGAAITLAGRQATAPAAETESSRAEP